MDAINYQPLFSFLFSNWRNWPIFNYILTLKLVKRKVFFICSKCNDSRLKAHTRPNFLQKFSGVNNQFLMDAINYQPFFSFLFSNWRNWPILNYFIIIATRSWEFLADLLRMQGFEVRDKGWQGQISAKIPLC